MHCVAQAVAGAAADGESAWCELQRLQPDVLVTDFRGPDLASLTGLELAQRIQRQVLPTTVIIVPTSARAGFLRYAPDAGVPGHLLKGAPAENLAEALALHLSHGTVRNYLSEVIGKLDVDNRIEAYRRTRQQGWLQHRRRRSFAAASAARGCQHSHTAG